MMGVSHNASQKKKKFRKQTRLFLFVFHMSEETPNNPFNFETLKPIVKIVQCK